MAKKNKCTICNSEYLEEVNQKLESGIAYTQIAAFLAEKGIVLSTSSIARHRKNHVIDPQKPKQLQKQAVMNAKKRANQSKNTPPDKLKLNQNAVNRSLPSNSPDDTLTQQQKDYLEELDKLTQDFDAINEMLQTLALAKERMKRAIREERDNDLVLSTTGKAIKDYADLVQEMKDMLSGSDSIAKMRFTQLVNMITEIFGKTDISDQTRLELYDIMGGFDAIGSDESEESIPSIRPSSNLTIDP